MTVCPRGTMPYDCMPRREMPFDRMPKYRGAKNSKKHKIWEDIAEEEKKSTFKALASRAKKKANGTSAPDSG